MNANQCPDPGLATGRFRAPSPRMASLLGAATVVLVAVGVPLAIASHDLSQGIVVLPFGIIGYVVARRAPRNPIGWILIGLTLAFLLSSDGGSYAVLVYRQGEHGLPFARVGVFLAAWWIWLLLLLPLPIALFPDGRLTRTLALGRVGVPCGLCDPRRRLDVAGRDRDRCRAHPGRLERRAGVCRQLDSRSRQSRDGFLLHRVLPGLCRSPSRELQAVGGRAPPATEVVAERRCDLDRRSLARHDDQQQQRRGPAGRRLSRLHQHRRAADRNRRRDPQVPAVRDRPADQPHHLVPDHHRPAGSAVHRNRRPRDRCAAVLLTGRGSRIDVGRCGDCSTRCDGGCSIASTGASTGPATTPRPSLRRSPSGYGKQSTSRPSTESSSPPSPEQCNQGTPPSGSNPPPKKDSNTTSPGPAFGTDTKARRSSRVRFAKVTGARRARFANVTRVRGR